MKLRRSPIVVKEFDTYCLGGVQSLLKEQFGYKPSRIALYNLKFGWIVDRIHNFINKCSVEALLSDEHDRKFFVAVLPASSESEEVVGLVLIRHWRGNIWELGDLKVHPSVRKLGIGSRLLSTALSYVKHKKGKEVQLVVDVNNIAALNLYKKHGFNVYPSRTIMHLKL